jgi:transcriptional regulator with XRE-family HTH domain
MNREVHDKFLQTPENRRLYRQEKLLVDVTELLASVMQTKGMSRAELARAIGKSKAFVTQVLRGNQNMTLRTVADLFGAMRHEVVVQAQPVRMRSKHVRADESSTHGSLLASHRQGETSRREEPLGLRDLQGVRSTRRAGDKIAFQEIG